MATVRCISELPQLLDLLLLSRLRCGTAAHVGHKGGDKPNDYREKGELYGAHYSPPLPFGRLLSKCPIRSS